MEFLELLLFFATSVTFDILGAQVKHLSLDLLPFQAESTETTQSHVDSTDVSVGNEGYVVGHLHLSPFLEICMF